MNVQLEKVLARDLEEYSWLWHPPNADGQQGTWSMVATVSKPRGGMVTVVSLPPSPKSQPKPFRYQALRAHELALVLPDARPPTVSIKRHKRMMEVCETLSELSGRGLSALPTSLPDGSVIVIPPPVRLRTSGLPDDVGGPLQVHGGCNVIGGVELRLRQVALSQSASWIGYGPMYDVLFTNPVDQEDARGDRLDVLLDSTRDDFIIT